jgi:hypothetical protein
METLSEAERKEESEDTQMVEKEGDGECMLGNATLQSHHYCCGAATFGGGSKGATGAKHSISEIPGMYENRYAVEFCSSPAAE